MPPKPLPPELTKALYSPEALQDLAERLGQFDDNKAWERAERERRENGKPPKGSRDADPQT